MLTAPRQELLEREGELSLIDDLGAGALQERGRLLILEGPPGIGKTALLGAARAGAADNGMLALGASAGPLEQKFPFGVIRQLFEPLLAAESEGERTSLLSGAAGLAAPLLGIGESDGALRAPGGPASSANLHGLYWLTANLTTRAPLLIAVDDAQWCDAASLRWLMYMARRVAELPVLICVATRPPEPADDLLRALLSETGAELVRPAPLSPEGTAAFLRGAFGEEPAAEFCAACDTAAGGNPFLLRELAAALRADGVDATAEQARRVRELGPVAVSRAILLRLARLPRAATDLARAVSILEADPTVHEAAAFAGLATEEAADAADALARAVVLSPGRPLRFAHPVVRRAVYADLAPAERARRHHRRARMLSESGAPPEAIATHLVASEPAGEAWTVESLRAGASKAFAQGALDEAIAFLTRALEEPPGRDSLAELLRELGVAETHARRPEAAGHLAEALERTADPEERASVALELGRALAMSGRLSDAVAVFDRAIADLPDTGGDLRLRLEADLIATARIDIGTRSIATERLRRIGGQLGSAGPSERLLMATLAFETVMAGESAENAAQLAERAFAGGRLLEDQSGESPVVYLAANALTLTDRLDLAHRYLSDALSDAQARGSVLGFAFASCFRSTVNYRRGALGEGEADARASLDVALAHGWALGLPNSLDFLLDSLIEQDRLDDAAEEVEAAQMGEEIPDTFLFNFLLESRGRLRILRGQTRAGIEDLLRCGRRQTAWGTENPTVIHWRSSAALAHHALGEEAEARALVGRELELARRFGAPRAIGIALTSAGTIAGGDDGLDLLREATDVLADSPALLERARAQVSLGAALRRAGRRSDAKGWLRSGLDLAHRCGGLALERQAREELRATGARPRRATLRGVESLTSTERRVAAMAADGLSNRDIAQARFVTVKTVEMHLSGAYRKLGVGSRVQLSAALDVAREAPAADLT